MKMTKENLEHIKNRFEQETGTKLPGKEPVDLRPYITRFAAAAAGLLCLAGAGLVWYKIGANKQATPASAPSTPAVTLELPGIRDDVHPVIKTEPHENTYPTQLFPTLRDRGEYSNLSDGSINMMTSEDLDATDDLVVPTTGEPVKKLVTTPISSTIPPIEISFDFADEIFGSETEWTFPAPASTDRGIMLSNVTIDTTTLLDNPTTELSGPQYISIPGTISDPVVAMHAGTVIEADFNWEDGNFIRIDIGTCILKYSHLASISVSSGDTLQMGDPVGTLGNTGRSTGPHLGLSAEDTAGTPVSLTTLYVSEVNE